MSKSISKPIKRRSKKSSPPAIDKLLKPSVGIVAALFGYFFFKGLKSEIPRVEVTDELALRQVFFGEGGSSKNYVVLCHSATSTLPVSSVFEDARSNANPELADFVMMDCHHVLPSGKNVIERFKFGSVKGPTIFMSGKIGSPQQVAPKHLKSGMTLIKYLRQMLEPHPIKITNTKVLKSSCLNKEYCALLIKGTTPTTSLKKTIHQLIESYEQIQFASSDGLTLAITNLEQHIPLIHDGKNQFLLFKKVSGGLGAASNNTQGEEKKSDSRLISSIAVYRGDDVSFGSLNTFLSSALSSSSSYFQKITVLPSVKTRTKKVEASLINKRQRVLEQRQRTFDRQNQPPSEQHTGAREERKAERDRRREQHHKDHNIEELSPEELAERERARRKDMEEESEKWFIQNEEEEFDDEESDEEEDILDLD